MTFLIIVAFSSFLITLLGTRLMILALRKKPVLLDIPTLRSNHAAPTPRGGGLAVVMALVICLLIADISYAVILSVLLLMAISLLDDLIDVSPLIRLIVQVMAVTVPLSMLSEPVFAGYFPLWLDRVVTGLLWVWFINLFNFMDGIDGLAASEMIAIGIGLSLIAAFVGTFPDAQSVFGLIVAASGAGFWWWNRQPAKIFLGDVGSIPIGFLLGYLLLLAVMSGYWAVALILPAYYLADASITLGKRLFKGKKIWLAHSEHYYQQAVRNGRRHDMVVRTIFGVNILLIFLAMRSVIDPELAMIHVGIAYLIVFMLLGFFAHERH